MIVDNDSSERPGPGGSSDLSALARRRLIKSAISTPVVLSTLASKPVLAGPHGCGVSNMGSPVPNSHSPVPNCTSLGQPLAYWMDDKTQWPSECQRNTVFNGFQGLWDTFSNKGGTKAATMNEVLGARCAQPTVLGRATVVSLLNAYRNDAGYPVTVSQIVQMFNLASRGQDYPVGSGSAVLTPPQVLQYLESLYPRSAF